MHLGDLIQLGVLHTLNLANNALTGKGMKQLTKLLESPRTNLRRLNISHNQIREQEVVALIASPQAMAGLEMLDVSRNELGVQTGVKLGKMLRSNTTLKALNLGWNNIQGQGLTSIALGLQHNSR